MSVRRPPAFPAWMLERLGYTRQNPALAGDLLEELQNGRSRGWYWRQALMVIVRGTARNAVVLRWYLHAVVAGLLAGLPVAYALWYFHLPHEAASLRAGISASLKLLPVLLAIVMGLDAIRWSQFGGKAFLDLRPLLAASRAGKRIRPEIIASVFLETVATYLCYYCSAVWVCGEPSLTVFICWQAVALLQCLTPALCRMLQVADVKGSDA